MVPPVCLFSLKIKKKRNFCVKIQEFTPVRIFVIFLKKSQFRLKIKILKFLGIRPLVTSWVCRELSDGNYPKVHFRFSILYC